MVVLDQLKQTRKLSLLAQHKYLVVIEETLGQGTHQHPGEGGGGINGLLDMSLRQQG